MIKNNWNWVYLDITDLIMCFHLFICVTIILCIFNNRNILRKNVGVLVGIQQEFARAPKMVTRPVVGKEVSWWGWHNENDISRQSKFHLDIQIYTSTKRSWFYDSKVEEETQNSHSFISEVQRFDVGHFSHREL